MEEDLGPFVRRGTQDKHIEVSADEILETLFPNIPIMWLEAIEDS